MDKQSAQHFIGVDVGTGSARAGIFDAAGTLIASAKRDIEIYRMDGDIVEQSSDNIWDCVCASVRDAMAQSGLAPAQIAGLGFDATCSLVVLDRSERPLTVSPSGAPDRNIIVWMDHRATDQAARINATGHRVLDYVGGTISPEMETPKLLWLKENMAESFDAAGDFFDLTDYLTWRATGDRARSVCTVTCKWTYLAHEGAWDASYFETIGLGVLAQEGFQRIGSTIVDPGTALGQGLTAQAAQDLGLVPGTAVAAGLIDAHAGGVGTVGASGAYEGPTARLAYVFGTSACTMSSSAEQSFVPGVWGPYYSAMVPGLWLSEGGQSAAGEAIAHLVKCHPAYPETAARAKAKGQHILDYLLDMISAADATPLAWAGGMVVVPEFLGNRAPFADPGARAIIAGLDLDPSEAALAGLYVAGLCGLGYGLRQIVNVQAQNGVAPELVVISGGAGADPVVRQLLADAAGIPFAAPGSEEPVLLGSAILGAVAAGAHKDLTQAMVAMSSLGQIYAPQAGATAERHTQRFAVFEALQAAARLNGPPA